MASNNDPEMLRWAASRPITPTDREKLARWIQQRQSPRE